jgi:hypothetical protein
MLSHPVLKTKPNEEPYVCPEINLTHRDKLQKYQAPCFITLGTIIHYINIKVSAKANKITITL